MAPTDWRYPKTRDKFMEQLYEYRKQEKNVEWTDLDRGIFVAMIEQKTRIWNSKQKFCKDDVMADFLEITETLQTRIKNLNVWAVVEKWCWMVEIYIRAKRADPPIEWRYNGSLTFLEPYCSYPYRYLGCLPMDRLIQFTEKFELPNWVEFLRDSENFFSLPENPLFFEELGGNKAKIGQVAPIKTAKQKRTRSWTLKNTSKVATPNSEDGQGDQDDNEFDEIGFSHKMYLKLIDLARDAAHLWHNRHHDRYNHELHAKTYELIARQICDSCATSPDVEIEARHVDAAWTAIKKKFYELDGKAESDEWRLFPNLHFLSHRIMPAILFDKQVSPPRNEPAMASTSSPPRHFSKSSINAVLENIVRNQKEAQSKATEPDITLLNELQKYIMSTACSANPIDQPPLKKSRPTTPPETSTPATMVVVNDSRNSTPTSFTWVPPKEEVGASTSSAKDSESLEIAPRTTPRRNCANSSSGGTPVIRTNSSTSNIEKQLRKLNATTSPPNNNFAKMSSITLQNPTIAQALLNTKPPPQLALPLSALAPPPPAPITTNPTNIPPPQDDKWVLLGKLIATWGREVEQRDALLGVHINKEIIDILNKYQLRSLGGG